MELGTQYGKHDFAVCVWSIVGVGIAGEVVYYIAGMVVYYISRGVMVNQFLHSLLKVWSDVLICELVSTAAYNSW